MKSPLKIIVIGDFGASDAIPNEPIEIPCHQLNDVFAAFQPTFTLDNKTIRFTKMEDFSVQNIRQQQKLDASDAASVTKVLHNSRFQEIESIWRGLEFLQKNLIEESIKLCAIHSTFDNVRQIYYDKVMLPQYNGQTTEPAIATLIDFDFTHKNDSFEVFQDLAKMGEAIKSPVIANTPASFFGIKNILHLSAIKDPHKKLATAAYHPFHAFRKTETAYWASLTINRFLQRQPYKLDDYTEPCSASKPETYLWGRAIWIFGANLIESYNTHGHVIGLAGLGTGGEQQGMPTRTLPTSRTEHVETPLEAPLNLDTLETLPYLGFSPLAQLPPELGGDRKPQMLYLHMAANLHHMQDPKNEKIGLLTVHTSLAYSITIGIISNLATLFTMNAIPAPLEQLAENLQQLLRDNLWHKEVSELTVVPDSGGLKIQYNPHLVIHTRKFEISLHIPL